MKEFTTGGGSEMEQHAFFFDMCPDGIVVLESNGSCFHTNKALSEIIGIKKEDILAHCFNDSLQTTLDILFGTIIRTAKNSSKVSNEDSHDSSQQCSGEEKGQSRGEVLFLNIDDKRMSLLVKAYQISSGRIISFIKDISYEQNLLNSLQQQDKKIHDITNSINGVVFQLQYFPSKPANYTYISNGAKDLFDLHPDEILKDSRVLSEMFHSDDVPGVKKNTLEAFLNRTGWEVEFRLITPPGDIKWIYSSAVPTVLADGKNVWTGFCVDITSRKQAEEKLKESEKRLYLHTQQSPLAYIELDTDLNIKDWNYSAEELFKYTKEEVLGKHLVGLLVPENKKEKVEEIRKELLYLQGTYSTTDITLDKDRNELFCEWVNNPITNEKGEVISITSLVKDVTEKKKAEDKIIESEKRFRGIATSSLDWFWQTDEFDRFSYVSDRYFDIVKLPKSKILDRSIHDMLATSDQNDLKIWHQFLEDIKNRRSFRDFEFKVDVYGVPPVWLRVSGVANYTESGEFLGYIGAGTDITQQILTENKLRSSEERFRQVAESVYDWIWEVDDKGVFTYVSDRYTKVTAIPKEKIIGRHLSEMSVSSDPDKQLNWKKALEDIMERKKFCDYEFVVDFPGMPEKWFKISGVPYYGSKGEFAGFRGTGSDITAQKMIEKSKKINKRRFEKLQKMTQSMFWETDSNNKLTFANENFLSRIGCDKSVIGSKFEILESKNLNNVLDKKDPINIENCLIRLSKAGEFEVSIKCEPFYDDSDTFSGYCGIILG